MLPTYGNQSLTHLTDCICTKGRYFVPMVCFYYFLCCAYQNSIYIYNVSKTKKAISSHNPNSSLHKSLTKNCP